MCAYVSVHEGKTKNSFFKNGYREGGGDDALDYSQNVQMTITKGSGRNSMFTNCRARNNRSHRFNNSHMTTGRL